MKKVILEVNALCKEYGRGENLVNALCGVNFKMLEGEFVGIMGESGSGKSTLLNCIATSISPTSGNIVLNGDNIANYNDKKLAEYRGNKIGYLFQEYELIDNLTAKENIMLPLYIHNKLDIVHTDRVNTLSKYLNVDTILNKFPVQLSGGEKQRVATVRSLILDPDILLTDEPTGALDSKNSKLLLQKLADLNEDKEKSILMVTHDANAASYCSRILFIQDGVVFHEIRKKGQEETQQEFYERILEVMSHLLGGSPNVL